MKGTEFRIWVDEFDFSCDTSQVDLSFTVGEGETTALCDTAQTFIPILSKATITQNGYIADVVDGYAAELDARYSAGASLVTLVTQQSDADCPCYVLEDCANYAMQFAAPLAGVMTLNGSWGVSTATYRGLRVRDATISATGTSTAIDFGAAGTVGGKAFLHVSAITGSATNADIVVQSSSDNINFADEGTFTFSAVGGYDIALSGTVNRYVRINTSDLGGATNFTVLVVVAISGVTY